MRRPYILWRDIRQAIPVHPKPYTNYWSRPLNHPLTPDRSAISEKIKGGKIY